MILWITVAVVLSTWFALRFSRKRTLPGPTPWPIIGNAHQMPMKTPWTVFSDWYKTYGNVIHLDVMGQSIVVINSQKIAKDLLDRRSAIYSDRPTSIMCGQLVGFGPAYAMQDYGEKFRKQRRVVSQGFSATKVPHYYNLQEKEAAILVHSLLQKPDMLFSEVHHRIGAVVLRIIYGYPTQSSTDDISKDAMKLMEIFNMTASPGNFLVDLIPSLRYLPRWMPGSGFLAQADAWRTHVTGTARSTYQWCEDNLESGKAEMPNLIGNILQDMSSHPSAEDQENLMWAAVGTLGGGLDTSASAMLGFFMAMILYPDVQKKAQTELDAIIGTDRLPQNSDRFKLPYLRSVIVELLRWAAIGPLGVPHALREDDVYEGYHFTKGTIVIANIWHMLHDPEVYDKPMEFNPDRFNGSEEGMAKVTDIVFGFGRRVCPGKNFVEGTLFSNIATALATCEMLPGVDDEGKEVLPRYAYTTGTVSFPEPFAMSLKARSPQASKLLAEAATNSSD